ncbi:MAG TPA: DUF4214 domain-containing protein [Pyrinomonadaceae bacterium]|jgi:hypothetical protein
MRRILTSLLLALSLLGAPAPARPYTYQYTDGGAALRWPSNTITVAFSTSLSNPGASIKAGTDVVGTVRRALQRWALTANVNFVETQSGLQSVSPSGGGDGVTLITIADTPENRAFVTGDRPGRTRVFFNPATGTISEADLVINPTLAGTFGGPGFSTDATAGTYDLEATFTHELGHLLGLDHSGVVGATMQPRQGRNFLSPALTMRTLSDDDRAAVSDRYGQRTPQTVGTLRGQVNYGAGAHVFAENIFSGRLFGSAITKADGSYEIQQLPPGQYRVVCEFLDEPVVAAEITRNGGPYAGIGGGAAFLTVETQAAVNPGQVTTQNLTVNTGTVPTLHPAVYGVNGQLIASPVPLVAGQSYRFYVGGFGLDAVPPANFTTNTPFITIDPASYRREDNAAFGVPYPIVSFDLRTADTAKFGDYSLRLQRTDTGEISYVSGGLALDPYTQTTFVGPNPVDDTPFFVRQQYLDFLFREPDTDGFNAWLRVLNGCSDVNNNPQCDRILVSSSFFGSPEFRLKGSFVYRFYKVALVRQPTYAETIRDFQSLSGADAELPQRRAAFANNFVLRTEFVGRYGALSNAQYVNTLLGNYGLQSVVTPDPANPDGDTKVTLTRDDFINRLNAGTLTRAQVLRAVAESDYVFQFEFNQAFVFMQYVGYLRRDPDTAGYNGWLTYLNTHPGDFRTMVNGFMNSAEYRSRFGPI